nr:hypothetical protein [Tanacetum cinerariifolium]
ERFMNYLKEQTDGEAMINSIKNGDQPLPRVTQVSIVGTTSTEQPPLKDKSMWHMLGSEYGEQDKKVAVLYEYETFKATKGELLLDTYIRYLQVINDLKKCGYSKDNYVNDAMGSKKKTVVVTSDPLALIAEKTNVSRSKEKVVVSSDSEGSEADDFNKDAQVLLAEDQAWMESRSDSDKEINANMVFMAQIKKVLSDSEASSSSADEKISEQNQRDVNDALGYKKKAVVVTSDPLALVAKKTKLSKRKEKVEVQTESEGSDDEDISDLKKITALLAKAFNQKNYYAKPTNNNLRTSSAPSLTNKKPKYVKSVEKKEDKKVDEKKRDTSKVKCYNCKKEEHFAKEYKKAKVKDHNYYKIKMLLAKKDSNEQVFLAEDQAWMESSSDYDQEINANMVFMAKMEKVLSDSDESSSSADELHI